MEEQQSCRSSIRFADNELVEIDKSKIPEKLRHLNKYAMAWSIGDDEMRGKVMEQTSFKEL